MIENGAHFSTGGRGGSVTYDKPVEIIRGTDTTVNGGLAGTGGPPQAETRSNPGQGHGGAGDTPSQFPPSSAQANDVDEAVIIRDGAHVGSGALNVTSHAKDTVRVIGGDAIRTFSAVPAAPRSSDHTTVYAAQTQPVLDAIGSNPVALAAIYAAQTVGADKMSKQGPWAAPGREAAVYAPQEALSPMLVDGPPTYLLKSAPTASHQSWAALQAARAWAGATDASHQPSEPQHPVDWVKVGPIFGTMGLSAMDAMRKLLSLCAGGNSDFMPRRAEWARPDGQAWYYLLVQFETQDQARIIAAVWLKIRHETHSQLNMTLMPHTGHTG